MQASQSFGAHLGSIDSSARDATGNAWFVRTSFEVRAETQLGDIVAVVGNVQQLGNWSPEHALRMTTDPGTYPVWRCDPLLLNEGEVEFKFIILRANGEVVWEERGNRRLSLKGTHEARVIADWGSHDAQGHNPLLDATPAPPPAIPKVRGRPDRGSLDGIPRAKHTSGDVSHDNLVGLHAVGTGGSQIQPGLVERLIVVQHHLPIKLRRDADGKWSGVWGVCSWRQST